MPFRAEQNGTTIGEGYFSTASFSYQHRNWDDQVTLTKRPYTMSDLLNTFSAAGLWIEQAVEPHMSSEAVARFPEKYAAVSKHFVGIIMFKLRPGKKAADFLKMFQSQKFDDSVDESQFINNLPLLSPKQTQTVDLKLEKGAYAFVCFMPDRAGVPHIMKGMILDVTIA